MKKQLVVLGSILFLAATTVTKPKVYVVGDSTAAIKAASAFPETGWAEVVSLLFDTSKVEIVDKAMNGRSSKSLYDEGLWTPIKTALKSGDYVIIQFGHNDEKTTDATRGTLPGSTFEQYLSIYINDALAAGAIPILATPIERNGWSNETTVKASHITSSGDYPQAVRNLATNKNLALIDMTKLTTAFYEKFGKDSTTNKLFMNLPAGVYTNYPTGNSDNTHLQRRGANEVAALFTAEVCNQKLTPISTWLKDCSAAIPTVRFKSTIPAISHCQADGVAESKNVGFQSAAYLNLNNVLGSQAEYVVCTNQATTTSISLRYANGGTAARSMHMIRNDQDTMDFNFAPTGTWTTWQMETNTISLSQGCQKLKIVSTTAEGGPNLDLLGFDSLGITLGDCLIPVQTISRTKPVPRTGNIFHLQTPTEIFIHDIHGKLIYSQFIGGSEGHSDLNVNATGLAEGLYIFQERAQNARHSTTHTATLFRISSQSRP